METVIVAGATGGIGQAICAELVESGKRVIGLGRSHLALQALRESLGDDHFTGIQADLRHLDTDALRATLAEADGITGLVNAAGISQGAALESLDDADWAESFAVNTDGPMRLSRLTVPFLRRSGKGSIAHIGSWVGLRGARKASYAASKAALWGLTMSMAQELGKDGIRVNLVLPGATITGMTQDWSDEVRAQIAGQTLLGRLCQPAEVAKVVRFLLSDDASYVTGTIVDVSATGFFGR